MHTRRISGSGLLMVLFVLVGCATPGDRKTEEEMSPDEFARHWMAEMDARPEEERVPHWEEIRALMMREPPKVGEMAPDFSLPTFEGDESVRLSDHRSQRPVVLIFGSWT